MPNGAKHWCLTLNNFSIHDLDRFEGICNDRERCVYAIVGKEVGESGTPHLQCFFSFRGRMSLAGVKTLFGARVHAEIARGSPAQAATYCKKDGLFEEFGVIPEGRGHRSDLGSIVSRIREGAQWDEILESDPTVVARYPRFVDRCLLRFGAHRSWVTETVVYWGETGTGKTRRAFAEALSPYVHSGGSWFDGYEHHADVIFDDFGGSEFKLTYLLKLLDRYPMRVPVKGSFANWVPKRVWITSNYSPKDWFPNAKDEHVRAMFRRFTKIIRFRRLASVLAPGDDSIEVELCVE